MPNEFPFSTEKSPSAVMEMLLRMKIKDAMTDRFIAAGKTDTFRDVQKVMKENHISGMPVVEDNRLVGLISIDDILTALDGGYINDSIEKHMTRNLMVLEDDMPLSFAISYFNKYRFRRYPVIDKEKKLVGMITSRDILASLVHEMDREIKELEGKIKPEPVQASATTLHKEFFINKFDFENAGKASFEIKKILKDHGASHKVIRRAAVASYELEINIAIHSAGGRLTFDLSPEQAVITAIDNGPGMKDVSLALKEGYSTANEWIRSLGFGAGMGLPNTKRFSDDFEITSEVGKGTVVKSVILLGDQGLEQSQP